MRKDEQPLSLDGRQLRARASGSEGEVDDETLFEFHQDGEVVWASYRGGRIRLGFLVGTLSGSELTFRYAQLNRDGETSTGRSLDRIEQLADGRVALHEEWAWESRSGIGRSVLEEINPR